MDDQFAVGRQQIPSLVKVFQLLHLHVLTDWGSQNEWGGGEGAAVDVKSSESEGAGRG